jgi:hypothetical protein
MHLSNLQHCHSLAGEGLHEHQCSFYQVFSGLFLLENGYETTDATIRFPLNEQLPLALIKKLVEARIRRNDEAEQQKITFQKPQ